MGIHFTLTVILKEYNPDKQKLNNQFIDLDFMTDYRQSVSVPIVFQKSTTTVDDHWLTSNQKNTSFASDLYYSI